MRKATMLIAAAAVACSGTLVSVGTASAATSGYGNCSATSDSTGITGTVCWDASTYTMRICDDQADGDTPYAYIASVGSSYQPEFYDGYGNGSCVYVYPYAGTFEINGAILYYAANVNSKYDVVATGALEGPAW
jgi:hypothetical protein